MMKKTQMEIQPYDVKDVIDKGIWRGVSSSNSRVSQSPSQAGLKSGKKGRKGKSPNRGGKKGSGRDGGKYRSSKKKLHKGPKSMSKSYLQSPILKIYMKEGNNQIME